MKPGLSTAVLALSLAIGCQAGPSVTQVPSAVPTSAAPTATRGATSAPSSPSPAASSTSPAPDPSVAVRTPWNATASMLEKRAGHTSTLLPDGLVLVTGGFADTTEENVLGSAELYDWTTRTWTATGAMITPRANHTATLLRDGTVLVVGGYCPGRTRGCPELSPGGAIDPDGAITLAEIYDPHTGVWTATGSMATARYLQSATLLDDGRVLVAGAEHGMPDAILPTTEIYDPATNAWQMVGDMTVGRTQQFTVKLDDGEVLVAGGMGPISPTDHGVLNSAEIYRPSIETWRRIGTELEPTDLLTPRAQGGAAVLLTNGMVLMAGGNGDNGRVLASAELFDSRIPSWTATGSLNTTRAELACAVLADGRVLVMGGFDAPENGKLLTSAETYDADTGTWSDAGDMRVPRFGHRATLLDDGTVLVSGGFTSGDATSSAELFDPSLER